LNESGLWRLFLTKETKTKLEEESNLEKFFATDRSPKEIIDRFGATEAANLAQKMQMRGNVLGGTGWSAWRARAASMWKILWAVTAGNKALNENLTPAQYTQMVEAAFKKVTIPAPNVYINWVLTTGSVIYTWPSGVVGSWASTSKPYTTIGGLPWVGLSF